MNSEIDDSTRIVESDLGQSEVREFVTVHDSTIGDGCQIYERCSLKKCHIGRTRAAEVSVVGNIASGPAARVILSYSEEHDIDLIVMRTHGRSGLRRYLIGSVTETVVRNAAVPVCCVPMR